MQTERRFAAIGLLLVSVSLGCKLPSGGTPISVSFNASAGSKTLSAHSRAGGRSIIGMPLDPSYYKPSLASLGALIGRFTPTNFILDLETLDIYQVQGGTYSPTGLLPYRYQPSGQIIPRNIDIENSSGFVRNVAVPGVQWNGLALSLIPSCSWGVPGHGITYMSVISVRLPSQYNGIHLPNEIVMPGNDPTLHWFQLSDLQPFATPFFQFLAIGSDIASPVVQNPNGTMPLSPPGYWDLPQFSTRRTTGNASSLFLNGPNIDLGTYANPDIVFSWDVNNLVEVYAGNLSPQNDIVTLNLSNPFPISIEVRERQTPGTKAGSDVTAPGEALFPRVYSDSGSNCITLQWVNPTDSDFNEVVVIRKANSPPADKNDGERVYEGFEPMYCDTDTAIGTTYYYRIMTVDYSGNYSTGVLGSATQS